MKFEASKSEGLRHEYDVVISAEDIENKVVEIIKSKAKTFKMQGFRLGHVPLNIVRSNLEDKAMNEALDILVSNASKEVVKESKVTRLATNPMYRVKEKYEKGKDLGIIIYFDETPNFDLKPYEMNIEKIIPNVSKKEINETIRRIIDNSPVYKKAEPDYAVKPKDEVSYHATCYNSGVESKKKSFSNVVMVPDVIPEGAEFLGNFVGKKVGEVFDFVPATDKNLTYKIEVKSINKAMIDITPEEYAKHRGFADIKKFEEAVKMRLEEEINDLAFIYHKSQILEQFARDYKFELPQEIYDREMRMAVANYKQEENASVSKPTKKDTKSELDEEIKKELEEIVNKRCILGYVLNKIAEKEKITINDEEIKSAIEEEINKNPIYAQKIVEYYTKTPGAVDYKKAAILERKVINFLLTKSTSNEVKKSKKEVQKIVDAILKEEE